MDSSPVGISTGMKSVNSIKRERKRNKKNKCDVKQYEGDVIKENKKEKNEKFEEKEDKKNLYISDVINERDDYKSSEEKVFILKDEKNLVQEKEDENRSSKEKQECQPERNEMKEVEDNENDNEVLEDMRSMSFEDKEKFKEKKRVRFLEELTNSSEDRLKLMINENGDVAGRALDSRSKEAEAKKVIHTLNAEPDKSTEQCNSESYPVERCRILNCEKEAILNWKKEYPSDKDDKLIERNNCDVEDCEKVKWISNLVDTSWKESRRVFLKAYVREQPLRCGVDSMADVSLISRDTWKYLNSPPMMKNQLRLEDAQGNSFHALGEVQLNLRIKADDYDFVLRKFKFIVVPELIVNCILGRDWMEFFEVTTKFGDIKSTITIGGKEIELADDDPDQTYPIVVPENQRIPGNTRILMTARVIGVRRGVDGIVEQIHETPDNIKLDPSISKISGDCIVLGIWNVQEKEVELQQGTVIGTWTNVQPVQVFSLRRRPEAAVFDKWLKEGAHIDPPSDKDEKEVETWVSNLWNENISKELSDKQKDQMLKLLKRRRQAFPTQGKLNECKLFDNVIQLSKEVVPLNQRQYPLPKDGEEAASEAINKLEKAGIIEQRESPWNQPVLLVKKPSGGWRTVIDYRGLNKLIQQPISTPLPKIDDTLRALGGNKYYSCVDMTDGFFQLSLAPESIPLTCFTYQGISYCYTRMPQGCKSSPASFQLAMQLVLQGLQWSCCVIYLDDVLIFSKTYEQHLKDVEKVLARFEKAGLTVKPKKCLWAQSSLDFLGHTINESGIKPKKENLQKLQTGKPPETLRQLRGFLGMVGQYRKFIPGYSILAAPLEKLLRKDVPYDWTDKQQDAYLKLRDILNDQQQLAFPDFDNPFLLTLDVTESCRSVLLSQLQDGKERRIGFASKKWKEYETRYPPMEQAASTMLFGINKFRAECVNQPVTVRTTCKELRWLLTNSQLQGRQAKWPVLMSHINYEIKVISESKLKKLMSINKLLDCNLPTVGAVTVDDSKLQLTGVDGTGGEETLFLTFDGGSRPSRNASAYGWCLWYSNWQPIAAEGCFTQGRTNNDQEFMALYAGVKAALSYRPAKLNIYGDSELIIDQIHQKKETRTIPSEVYKKITMDLLKNIPTWTITHVPRLYNQSADYLCNAAMDLRKDVQLNTRIWKHLIQVNLIPKWIRKQPPALVCSVHTRTKKRDLALLQKELIRQIDHIHPEMEWEADQSILQKLKLDQDRTPWMYKLKQCLRGEDTPNDTIQGQRLA